MESTHARSVSTGFGQSWRELARMPMHQVPVVLGAFVATAVGILTYVFDAIRAGSIVAVTATEAYLVLFGVLGLVGYGVSKQNVQNGSLVAAIAGIVLVAIAGGTTGLITGLLLLFGAAWSLSKTR